MIVLAEAVHVGLDRLCVPRHDSYRSTFNFERGPTAGRFVADQQAADTALQAMEGGVARKQLYFVSQRSAMP